MFGLIGAALGAFFIRRVDVGEDDPKHRFSRVERIFVVLQILTACAIAFAHGSNDVANSIGPLAAISHAVQGMDLGSKAPVEPWMLAIGGIGIVIGLATWGYRVMETIGKKITELTPSRGFSAELAAATTIVLASRLGFPSLRPYLSWGCPRGGSCAWDRGFGSQSGRKDSRFVGCDASIGGRSFNLLFLFLQGLVGSLGGYFGRDR
ncbi:MAG: hypothetical protein CM1200mP20_03080 [Pseudomonadota bacterium]|nr:MAG: hypothetical protein CM1200mP20_03080 [Pseudomonadota bacterium]